MYGRIIIIRYNDNLIKEKIEWDEMMYGFSRKRTVVVHIDEIRLKMNSKDLMVVDEADGNTSTIMHIIKRKGTILLAQQSTLKFVNDGLVYNASGCTLYTGMTTHFYYFNDIGMSKLTVEGMCVWGNPVESQIHFVRRVRKLKLDAGCLHVMPITRSDAEMALKDYMRHVTKYKYIGMNGRRDRLYITNNPLMVRNWSYMRIFSGGIYALVIGIDYLISETKLHVFNGHYCDDRGLYIDGIFPVYDRMAIILHLRNGRRVDAPCPLTNYLRQKRTCLMEMKAELCELRLSRHLMREYR
jgi:hypothetical protein